MEPVRLYGIVLRSVNYREYDRMLTLFTREKGRVEVSAKGAHRPSGKLAAPSTQFALGEYILQERNGQYLLSSCTIDKTHYALRESPDRLACAVLYARLCLEAVQENEPNEPLFLLLLQALAYLEAGHTGFKELSVGFLLRYLAADGQGVVLSRCAQCGGPLHDARFDFAKGGLVCAEHAASGSGPATREQVLALRRCAQGERLIPCENVSGCYEAMRGFTEYLLDHKIPAFDYFENMLAIT